MTKKADTNKESAWFRRKVPAGYARATLILTGTAPLLMNSGEFDRDGETFRAYYLLGQKKRKTIDDEKRIRELEWNLKIYLDEEVGPYIPGKNVKELLRSAATKWRRGEDLKRSLIVVEYRIPLLYDGPRDQAGLWEAGYRYEAMVSNAGMGHGRVVRCRPKFDEWSLAVELAYDPEDIDFDFLSLVAERAMKYGLGDYRPEFGAFSASLEQGELHKAASNGTALKQRDREQVLAHIAFSERIMVGVPE